MSDASSSPAGGRSPTPSDASNAPTPPRKARAPSDGNSSSDGSPVPARSPKQGSDLDEDDAGLFGEASGDEQPTAHKRTLDDQELDSGDDSDRRDRMDDDIDEREERELNTVEISLGRHPIAHQTDGELYLVRYSRSVGLHPSSFHPKSFKPPKRPHHDAPPTAGFSSAQTANTAIRWRPDLDDPATLQSNTRMIRWSDGSVTLQLASNATEMLELPPKVLAPPQINPSKPTPTAISSAKNASIKYEPRLDSHTYLASIHQDTAFAQLTNHVTTSLTVQANIEENDDALIRLQEQLAAMSKGYAKADQAAGPGVVTIIEDPESAKRKEEAAARERQRAQKRRDAQEQRMRDRQNGVLSRAGLRDPYGTGAGELEGAGMPRARKPARKPRRRGSDYSDDEDDYRRGRTREDEYDEDDGFVAGSDEEVEYMEDDDDLDRGVEARAAQDSDADGDADDDADVVPPAARSPKRPRNDDDDEPGVASNAKRGRRQVLDDDDED